MNTVINEIINNYKDRGFNPTLTNKTIELIMTIHKLHRVPKLKTYNNGIVEKYFTDGTEQASYYALLRTKYKNVLKKIKNKETLDAEDIEILFNYSEVDKVIKSYNKNAQLIKTINEGQKVPSYDQKFESGKSQKIYYDNFRRKINKILEKIQDGIEPNFHDKELLDEFIIISNELDKYSKKAEYIKAIKNGKKNEADYIYYKALYNAWMNIKEKMNEAKPLTLKDIETIQAYIEICAIIDKYNNTDQLLNTIDKIHRLPKRNELKFTDQTDQRYYYDSIRKEAKLIHEKELRKEVLSEDEINLLAQYKKIRNKLYKYSKTRTLIQTIHELQRVPKIKEANGGIIERKFEDGTEQAVYYYYMRKKMTHIYYKMQNNEHLSLDDEETVDEYKKIKEAIDQYSKKTQFIKTLHELKRPPKTYALTTKIPERTFTDGLDQFYYYHQILIDKDKLEEKIKNNIPLSFAEYEKLKECQEVFDVILIYSKKLQFIKHINKTRRDPRISDKGCKTNMMFEDGTNQDTYFRCLRRSARQIKEKQKNNQTLTPMEKRKLEDYQTIENVLSFYPNSKKENITLITILCQNNNINIILNHDLLRKSYYEVYCKLCFLNDNNLPITDEEGYINPIMYQSEENMKINYNITLDELINKYIDGHINSSGKNLINKITLK